MFFDYVLIASFILSAIIILISAIVLKYIKVNSAKEHKPYHEIQSKLKIYLNILYFFLLSIFTTRLLFCVFFPMQLIDLNIYPGGNTSSIVFMIYQGSVAAFYLFFIFLFWLHGQLQLLYKYQYLIKVLKFILYFIVLDLIISMAGYLKFNYDLLFNVNFVDARISKPPSLLFFIGLIGILIFVSDLFFLLKKRRQRWIQGLYSFLLLITTGLALIIGYMNFVFYMDLDVFKTFTYHQVYYSWLWFLLILAALGSQIITSVILNNKSKFLNHYFAINYSLQLNRISVIAAIGLSANAVLPQVMLYFING